jgi:hypothetical protein
VRLDRLTNQGRLGAVIFARASISGVPSGVDEVRFTLTDPSDLNPAAEFVTGPLGADGEGLVDCEVRTDIAEDPVAVCTGVETDADGAFFVDFRVFHPPGQPGRDVTISVDAIGAEEPEPAKANNSAVLTLGREQADVGRD